MIRKFLVLGAAISSIRASSQTPFTLNALPPDSGLEGYEFEWPVKNVAIIGAGVGGLMAYRAFTECKSFDSVRVFERDDLPGGNWHYTDEAPNSVPIHNRVLPDWWKSDYKPTTPPKVPFKIVHRVSNNDSLSSKQLEWERLGHRAPKPIWASLEANTPTSVQQIPGFGWPANVPTATYQWHIERYLRSFASWLGVNVGDKNPHVSYSTRVESVEKRYNEAGKHHGWTLLLRKFVKTDEKTYEESWWTEDFDAVAVATGRFQVPSIPLIPGLVDWQARFPDQIQHTRQYRRPETYANKNVLVVGAGPSSTEIARDVNMSVKRCYLSLRPSNDFRRPLLMTRVPNNTSIIGEIKTFHPIVSNQGIQDGIIELVNGTNITGIDNIILGTGYLFAYPFLSQYHNSSVRRDEIPEIPEQPLVTDGTHIRSLYRGIFYIDQPTIGFINAELGIETFQYGQYSTAALAKVWAGQAKLPTREKQWEYFWKVVNSKGGLGPNSQKQSRAEAEENLRYFVGWLNAGAVQHGGSLLDVPQDWSEKMALWMRARYQRDPSDAPLSFVDEQVSLAAHPKMEDYTQAILDDW